MSDKVWVALHCDYDGCSFHGVFATERAALTFLEMEHERAVREGERMEEREREDGRSSVRTQGYWLPTAIQGGFTEWHFDDTQGGPGHGRMKVFEVTVQTEGDD